MSFKLIKIVAGPRRTCGGSHLESSCARPTLRTAEPSGIYISLQTYLAKVMSSDRAAQEHKKINKETVCRTHRCWTQRLRVPTRAPSGRDQKRSSAQT